MNNLIERSMFKAFRLKQWPLSESTVKSTLGICSPTLSQTLSVQIFLNSPGTSGLNSMSAVAFWDLFLPFSTKVTHLSEISTQIAKIANWKK